MVSDLRPNFMDYVSRMENFFLRRVSLCRLAFFMFFVAFIPRLHLAFTSMTPVACDEIFQTVEIAHRIVFGRGFRFWEWHNGLRSYSLPAFFTPPYFLAKWIGIENPRIVTVLVKSYLALFHALGIMLLFLAFSKISDRFRAFFAVLPMALWYVAGFISVRTLGETAAIPFIFLMLYLNVKAEEERRAGYNFFSGMAAGFAFMLRIQTLAFSAGLGVFLLIFSRERIRSAYLFTAGCVVVIVFQGLLDLYTWGSFLHSFFAYMDFNFFQDGASRFGTSPWYFYFIKTYEIWPVLFIVPAVFFLFTASFSKKYARFTLPVILFSAIHIATSHKETRFLFPIFIMLPFLTMGGIELLSTRFSNKNFSKIFVFSSLIIVFTTMFSIPFYPERWAYSHEKNNYANSNVSFLLGSVRDVKHAWAFRSQKDFTGGHAWFNSDATIHYVRKISDSKQMFKNILRRKNCEGCYIAVRKADKKYFLQYKKRLRKIKETDNWLIFRIISG